MVCTPLRQLVPRFVNTLQGVPAFVLSGDIPRRRTYGTVIPPYPMEPGPEDCCQVSASGLAEWPIVPIIPNAAFWTVPAPLSTITEFRA